MHIHVVTHIHAHTYGHPLVSCGYISSLVGLYVYVRSVHACTAQTHKLPDLFMHLSNSGVPLFIFDLDFNWFYPMFVISSSNISTFGEM